MKRILILLMLIVSLAGTASAQRQRGVALGIDKDSLLFLIGSPFDNWYVTFGAGLQTFRGNEVELEASINKLNYNLYMQIGKWVIPDLAVSLRYSYFTVDGQSRYGLQPFINYTGVHVNEDGYYDYQPFHAQAMALVGLVTLDWTNLFLGYEAGRRTRTHIYSPLGMGISMLYGPNRNPRRHEVELGDMMRNYELCYEAAVGVEYYLSRELALNARAAIFGSESTWDWSPYDNTRTRFDLMPQFTVGARINLLSHVNKRNPYTHETERAKVYHEFLTVGSSHELARNERDRNNLARKCDSLSALINNPDDKLPSREDLINMYDSLQNKLDSLDNIIEEERPHGINVLEDLINANQKLNLPAAIVYYELDRYKIDYNGRKRLQRFVREVSELDDTLEFFIIGAADSITGSIRHNQWLSERRSEAAFRMMVDHFDADPNQYILVPAGGIMDYDPPEYNRMAMVILRTPETEAIVRRWIKMREMR